MQPHTLRVGYAHRHTLVETDAHQSEFGVYDQAGEPLAVIPRTSGKEVTRTEGYGVRDRFGWVDTGSACRIRVTGLPATAGALSGVDQMRVRRNC